MCRACIDIVSTIRATGTVLPSQGELPAQYCPPKEGAP